jgi:hypothetical protein
MYRGDRIHRALGPFSRLDGTRGSPSEKEQHSQGEVLPDGTRALTMAAGRGRR